MTIEERVTSAGPTVADAVGTQPQEATEAPAAAPAELSPEQRVELDKTSAWVNGIREKANRATAEADAAVRESSGEDGTGEEVAPETAAAPSAKDGERATEEKPRRTLADLNADHRARILEKQNRKLQARIDSIVGVLESFQAPVETGAAAPAEAAQAPAAPAEPAKAESDPEPDFDLDPKEWHRWNERQLEQRMAEREQSFRRELLDQLKPVIDGGKFQQQQAGQLAEAEAAQARSKAIAREVGTLVDEYKDTTEGAGYFDRVNRYATYFIGDLVAQGASEQDAMRAFQAEAMDLMVRGEDAGHHPVAYYDSYIMHKARLAAGLPGALSAAGTAAPRPAAGQEPARTAPAPTTQQRLAESDLAAAAAASRLPEATAGHDRDAVSAGPASVEVGQMARRGKVNVEMLKSVAAAQNRDPMAVVREMMKAATG